MPEPTTDTPQQKPEEKTPDALSKEELDKVSGGVKLKFPIDGKTTTDSPLGRHSF